MQLVQAGNDECSWPFHTRACYVLWCITLWLPVTGCGPHILLKQLYSICLGCSSELHRAYASLVAACRLGLGDSGRSGPTPCKCASRLAHLQLFKCFRVHIIHPGVQTRTCSVTCLSVPCYDASSLCVQCFCILCKLKQAWLYACT